MSGSKDIQRVAAEGLSWFETAAREDGSSYVRTRDGSPEWIGDLVREAHGDMLPDNHRYELIQNALEFIAGGEEDDGTFADQSVPAYNSDRISWLASHGTRYAYVDEAVDELGHSDEGILGDIALGMYFEAREVFGSVMFSLETQRDES